MLDEFLNLFRSFDEQGYDKKGFDRQGFNKEGIHRNGTRFDRAGYDIDGYDARGFDVYGFDREGFDALGLDEDGFDREGYDAFGYDEDGFDREGLDEDGYNREGYDKAGYNRAGYNKDGYNRKGFNRDGYNQWGFDCKGFNRDGFDREGYDREGYDKDGYNREGYDRDGLDKDLFTEDGRFRGRTLWYLDTNLQPSDISLRLAQQAVSIAPPLEHDRILKNAYGIIGSVTPLTAREARRKTGEIEKLLAIGIEPELTLDLSPIHQTRTTEQAKRASDQLASQKREPVERFFWFMRYDDEDDVSALAYSQMSQRYIHAAYHTWLTGASEANEEQRKALYYKNAALAATLIFMNEYTAGARDAFVTAWNETMKRWQLLPAEPASTATVGVSDKETSLNANPVWRINGDQKRSIASDMIELLYETSIRFDDPRIAQLAATLFGTVSHRFFDKWMAPVLAEIESVCNDLRACLDKLAEANNQQERSSLESKVTQYETRGSSIIDSGRKKGILQSDDSRANKTIDAFAQVVRNAAIAFIPTNDQPSNSDLAYVKKHLDVARKHATSDDLKQKIEQDARDLQKLRETLAYVEERDKQIEQAAAHANARRFNEAVDILTRLKLNARTPEESQWLGRLINQVQQNRYTQQFIAAMNARNLNSARYALEKVIEYENDPVERLRLMQRFRSINGY